MTTLPKRHTYYGGSTSEAFNPALGSGSFPRRKKNVTFGPYIVGSTLGEGEFGKVKLGWSKSTASANEVPKQVAIKLIRRDSIPKHSEKEIKVYREINALKHLNHPNIVRLEEVLQNSKYIGIVLEYASGGEFYKYIQKKRRLKEPTACRLFAQLVSGVNYMHSKGLVHRDLKLENLLLDKHENLLITDFGFVNEFSLKNELMKTSCGSPCYAAPELVITTNPYEARKADIWSCGVIMYAMLAGYLPWDDDADNPDGDDIAKLYRYITRSPLKFPEYITPLPRDLLRKILVSDPRKRLTLEKIQLHGWLQPHSPFLSVTVEEWDRTVRHNELFRFPPQRRNADSVRPRSTCSISSANSKGDKRNSLIMDSNLYPVPVPPQESQSHVMAKPSSPSSEMRQSPIKGMRNHSRRNSAASIALQTVVDAERDFQAHHGSSVGSRSTAALNTENLSHSSSFSSRYYSQSPTKSAGANGLSLRESVIIEVSPQKGPIALSYNGYQREPFVGLVTSTHVNMSPPLQNNVMKIQNIASAHSLKHTSDPSHQRKMRPTSYHPVSYSHQSNVNEAKLSSDPLSDGVQIALDETIEGSGNARDRRSLGEDQHHNTPGLPRGSDPSSFVNTESEKVSDLPSPGTDTLMNNSDMTIMADDVHKASRSPLGDIPTIKKMSENNASIVTDENKTTSSGVCKGEAKEKVPEPRQYTLPEKRGPKRFSILSFYSNYTSSKSNLEVTSGEMGGKTSAEEKSRSQAGVKLGFETKEILAAKEKTASRAPSADHSSQRRIPSGPKNPVAETTSSRQVSSGSTYQESRTKRNNRMSVAVSSLQQPQVRPREQSTAKRVMDFFKRRSMRL
ncbi:LAMI_0H05864g1_1 [Lachancea mirantina]|uniref:non-specific serine/threonine protein kinase n=1 Tax=Lachancea mirantina TaxID=1230905 RepID=A0A1G4KFN4_9SACH|nr:LAMI_0H05864g1_1 [Lachancea mirantina]